MPHHRTITVSGRSRRTPAWLAAFAVALVCLWPPENGRSLALQLVSWAVDPRGELPLLPKPFAPGAGDDPEAVAAHDAQVQAYDALYLKGGWTRRRLELKAARDPFDPATERQAILALGIVTAFLFWRVTRRD